MDNPSNNIVALKKIFTTEIGEEDFTIDPVIGSVTPSDAEYKKIGELINILKRWFELLSKEANNIKILISNFNSLKETLGERQVTDEWRKKEKLLTGLLRLILSKKKFAEFLTSGLIDGVRILINIHSRHKLSTQPDVTKPFTDALFSQIRVYEMQQIVSEAQTHVANIIAKIPLVDTTLTKLVQDDKRKRESQKIPEPPKRPPVVKPIVPEDEKNNQVQEQSTTKKPPVLVSDPQNGMDSGQGGQQLTTKTPQVSPSPSNGDTPANIGNTSNTGHFKMGKNAILSIVLSVLLLVLLGIVALILIHRKYREQIVVRPDPFIFESILY